MKTVHSAGIVVFRYEEQKRLYLLLLYPGHYWDFSKGIIEKGEEPREAATRELKEEAGLDAGIIDDFKTSISYWYFENNQRVKKTVTYFAGETTQTDVTISYEHRDYRWEAYRKARSIIRYPEARTVLDEVEKFLNGTTP